MGGGMANAISLRKFLMDKGVNLKGVWVNAIVTLKNNNFEIEKRPKRYNILSPSKIPKFILNHKSNVNINILKESALIIEPYGRDFI